MENANTSRTHPLVLAAAASVLVVSAAGTAALMGWLPATRAPQAAEPVPTMSAIPAIPPLLATAPEAPAVSEAKPTPEAGPVPQAKPALPKPAVRKPAAPKSVGAAKPAEEPVRIAYDSPVPPPPGAIPAPINAPPPVAGPAPVASAPPPVCHDCGVVASIRTIETPGEGSGVGAVAGGVAGGAVGSQFGKGKGQIVGAVIGAVGGAIAGHEVERHVVRKHTQYEIAVKLDDGTMRTILQEAAPTWRQGDRVQLNGNEIRSAS